MGLVGPQSVVDVGCGTGAWLRVFRENNVARVSGIDGDYVDSSTLLIDPADFIAADLSRPFEIKGHYDLAVCLEVGEHLPGSNAPCLVEALTAAAPVVLFSTAPPGQGGEGHINEQWPSYWRGFFDQHGYSMLDPIRPRIREDDTIVFWYRQNIVMFAGEEGLRLHPRLRQFRRSANELGIEWIHVDSFATALDQLHGEFNPGARRLLIELLRALKRSIRRRLGFRK